MSINVIICGIVKNAGKVIKNNIELAIMTGQRFNRYKIIIYENNSTDDTKSKLKEFLGKPFITIISEDVNEDADNEIMAYKEITGSDHPCRIELISNARNRLLNEIRKEENESFTHVIVIDLDATNGWQIDGIMNSFQRDNWDAVFGYSDPYYDYYALRTGEIPFGPEIIGETFWKSIRPLNINSYKLRSVFSAFNGIGIYKKQLLMKYNYNFKVDDNVKKFYRNILKGMKNDNIFKPCIKFPYFVRDEESDILWKANSGYKAPVVCEHCCLHFAMINDGYKLYINPLMKYYR